MERITNRQMNLLIRFTFSLSASTPPRLSAKERLPLELHIKLRNCLNKHQPVFHLNFDQPTRPPGGRIALPLELQINLIFI
jgi:hypothetical protein